MKSSFPVLYQRRSQDFRPSNIPGLAAWYDTTRSVYSDGGAHFTAASSQSLAIANAAQTNLNPGTGNCSVSAWLKLDSNSATAYQLTKGAESDGVAGYGLLTYTSGRIGGVFTDGTGSRVYFTSATSTVTTATWYHVVINFDRAGSASLYLNGNLTPVASASISAKSGSCAPTTPFVLGAQSAATLSSFHDGSLDSVAYFNRLLANAEITSLYNSGAGRVYADLATIGFSTTSLVSWWDLNEETGTRYDSYGTNHLTASTTVLISPSVLNGGFETAGGGGADVFGSWTEAVAGTSTINDETSAPHAGAHACRMDIDASNSAASITQVVLTVGNRYSYTLYAKADSGTPTIAVGPNTHTLTTSYATYSGSFTATSTSLTIANGSAASKSLFVDNITLTDLGPVGVPGIAAGVAADENWCGQFSPTTMSNVPCLTVGSNSNMAAGNEGYFVSAWFLLDSPIGGTNQGIIATDIVSTAATGEWQLYVYGTQKVMFDIFVSSVRKCNVVGNARGSIAVSTWHHVLAWYDPVTEKGNLLIDGTYADNATCTVNPVKTGVGFAIGAYTDKAYGFAGRIDNVIFGKPPTAIGALAATIASTLYGNGTPPKPSALTSAQRAAWGVVSGWGMDKLLGLTGDSIGTNTLTNNGAVTYGQGVDYYEGVVAKELDLSPNGKTLTQTTQGLRPAYVTNYQNGKAMLLFQGANYLTLSSLALSTVHSAFFVVKPTALSGVLCGGTSGNSLATLGATNVTYNAQGTSVAVAHGMSINTAYILSVIRNGTTVQYFVNGTQVGTDQTLGANSTLTVTTVGAYSDATSPCSAYLVPPLIYTTALSAAQQANVISYLRNYYGI